MQILRTVRSSAILQIKQSFSRSMFKFVIVIAPIFFGLTMGFVYMNKPPEYFVSYVMIGTATTTMWSSISFSSAGDIERERYMGALEQIFNSPQSFYFIMLGKVIGNTILGVASMIFSFIYVSVLFRVPIEMKNPGTALLIFLVTILSYEMIAMMLSGLLAISRQTRTLMNCMDFPVFILTGSVFPISILPEGIRWLAYLLSPTYGIHLFRMCIKGVTWNGEFLVYGGGLLLTTMIYAVLSVWLYRFVDKKARIDATLEVA